MYRKKRIPSLRYSAAGWLENGRFRYVFEIDCFVPHIGHSARILLGSEPPFARCEDILKSLIGWIPAATTGDTWQAAAFSASRCRLPVEAHPP